MNEQAIMDEYAKALRELSDAKQLLRDLLEALKICERALDPKNNFDQIDALHAARAAIVKAEGI